MYRVKIFLGLIVWMLGAFAIASEGVDGEQNVRSLSATEASWNLSEKPVFFEDVTEKSTHQEIWRQVQMVESINSLNEQKSVNH